MIILQADTLLENGEPRSCFTQAKNLECTRKKMWYGPQSKEMEAKPYFDARILVIHMKITIL